MGEEERKDLERVGCNEAVDSMEDEGILVAEPHEVVSQRMMCQSKVKR
jgi:hypothetical protein